MTKIIPNRRQVPAPDFRQARRNADRNQKDARITATMKILYTSQSIRNAIVGLMSPGKVRRVAITAFVGNDARAYIPRPHGVEIVCWPKAGGTNPLELRRLKKLGAKIRFCDGLHMKVYWASSRGSAITSANLSTNALGAGGLKEIGVLLPNGALDIDKVLASLKTRPFNKADIDKLEMAHRELAKQQPRGEKKTDRVDYTEWFTLPARSEWKLIELEDYVDSCQEAKAIVQRDFNKRSPEDGITCRKNDYKNGDWVLYFRLLDTEISELTWMSVDFIAKINPKEEIFERDFPYQAIQAWSLRHYPPPPFNITKDFNTAFKAAVLAYGKKRLERRRTTRPPEQLLELIAEKMKK